MSTRGFVLGVLCLFVLAGLPLAAQEPRAFTLVEEVSGPAPSLAALQSWRIAAELDTLRTAPPRLSLTLGPGELRVAELLEFERRADDNYTWRGMMADGEGSVTLTVRDAVLAGFIEAGKAVYEIVPRERGVSSLALLDSDRFPECGTTREHAVHGGVPPENEEITAPVSAAVPDTGGRIDVMVVYTAAARQAAGGTANIQATAQAAIDAANTAYANSQIVQRVRLVHTSEVAYDETTGEYSAHLSWVTGNAAVAALRNAHRADLVDMMVQDSQYCGLGWLMSTVGPAFEASGFTVTTRSCAVGNFSLAHELGHNMGAHHDPANGGTAAYPYSYGHFVNGSYRTVMSYATECSLGCTRVSRFSNPDVAYLGTPTGIANARDNHRTLNNTANVVANFRQEAAAATPSDYYTLNPCRILDTRTAGPALPSGATRQLGIAGICGVPADATAVALNVTVIGATGSGNLILYPTGEPKPTASTINFAADVPRANNAILALPTGGAGTLAAEAFVSGSGSAHVLLDVSGYFAVPAAGDEGR